MIGMSFAFYFENWLIVLGQGGKFLSLCENKQTQHISWVIAVQSDPVEITSGVP